MPTFVLIPGNSLNGGIFRELIPLLPEGEVHIQELTGHGPPPNSLLPLTEQYGFPAQGRKLAEWMEERDLRDVVLIGVSFGGQVCAQALPRIKDRVKLLISTGAPPLTQPFDQGGFRIREEFPLFFTPHLSDDDVEALAKIISTKHVDEIAEMIRATPPAFREAGGMVVSEANWADEFKIMQEKPCPIVFVLALGDPLINSGYIRDKAGELGFPFFGLTSDSHVPMLDDPEAYSEAVRQALASVETVKDEPPAVAEEQ